MGFGGTGGGGGAIANATDANISVPAANNILVYSNLGKWTNTPIVGTAALATGGGQETVVTSNSSTTTTLDLASGNVFNITLVGNTTFAFSGATNSKACAIGLYLRQDATGGRTVAWPASVKWAGGTAPTLTTTASALDILVFESLDGGTTWYGSLAGANYS